jgi:hypothetical protein
MVRVFCLVAVLLISPVLAVADEHGPVSLTVHVYRYATVRQSDLAAALAQTTRALQAAGIGPDWRFITRQPSVAPRTGELTVLLLTPEMTAQKCARDRIQSAVLGTSAPAPGRAWIFVDRISEVAETRGLAVSDILGQVITHELGHLLLGADAHDIGVMREHVLFTGAADFRFTRAHGQRMRARLIASHP